MKSTGIGDQGLWTGGKKREGGAETSAVPHRALVLSMLFVFCITASPAFAEDDMVKLIETKRAELQEREVALKREEQRLAAVKKDVDERIEKYTKLLAQVEAQLKRVEQVKGDKMENVVKAYEVMAAEDAAARISALDDDTALQIMLRMKSKKAGAVIAAMSPQKAALLTRSMMTLSPQK